MTKKRTSASLLAVLALALLVVEASAQQTEPAPQAKPAAPRPSLIESVKRHIKRLGATIDDAKSSGEMVVSNYNDPRGGKTTIVVINDRRKNLLGFYIYNFGSVKNATNREDVYKYLLQANDDITLGSFFVDKDSDIGYKYLVTNTQMANSSAFDSVYLTMASVVRDRRAEIKQLLGNTGEKEEKQPEKQ
jgi:hypothetical protein